MLWALVLLPAILGLVSSARSVQDELQQSVFEAPLQYTTFSHPHFPGHSIRARKPKLCEHVEEWSGYLDLPGGRHLYWHSYESRHKPEDSPVMLWLNGGPGCSSFCGMFQELGPCTIARETPDSPVFLTYNPYSWTTNATIIFLDQPVGVGYSYADRGDKGPYTTEAAAVDVHAFLQLWFKAFEGKFGGNDFHMAGESYAGRYLPVFSDYIIKQNALPNDLKLINLKSVLIGNGWTHPEIQYSSYLPTACDRATGYGPYLDEATCTTMRESLPRCQQLMRDCAANATDAQLCQSGKEYCEKTQTDPFYATGRNAFDMEKRGDYPEDHWVEIFLNYPKIRHEIGVDHERHHGRDAPKEFFSCSDKVGKHFDLSGDGGKPSFQQLANVLDAGVPVLMYSGTRDFVCNAAGNDQVALQLPWSGREAFAAAPMRDWKAEGEIAGRYRSAGNLTFATVYRSGHFVPYDQPRTALALATSWLYTQSLDSLATSEN